MTVFVAILLIRPFIKSNIEPRKVYQKFQNQAMRKIQVILFLSADSQQTFFVIFHHTVNRQTAQAHRPGDPGNFFTFRFHADDGPGLLVGHLEKSSLLRKCMKSRISQVSIDES